MLSDKGLEYRHLLDRTESLATIAPDALSDDKLEAELHRINYDLEKQHRRAGQSQKGAK